MVEKLEYRTCPECGNVYKTKSVDKIMLGQVLVRMKCEQGHEWLEHYNMQYIGYEHNNIRYDMFGNIMYNLNKNEQTQEVN